MWCEEICPRSTSEVRHAELTRPTGSFAHPKISTATLNKSDMRWCTHRSKNTVDRNYLPDAKNWGADIFTKLRVSHIALAKDGKWLVHFEPAG